MSRKILVIEDTADVRELLRQLFEMAGYEVLQAANGAEALNLLENGTAGTPGLILLDLMMPTMNGWEFRRRQKRDARISGIPVVLISAGGNVDDQAFHLDAVDCLQKPFNSEDLLRLAERYCHDA